MPRRASWTRRRRGSRWRSRRRPWTRRGAAAAAAAPAAAQQGGFYRSDDAGATWTKLSGDTALWGRGWYFENVVVDPKNADIVYVPNVALSRSKDGGKTWVPLRGSPGGDDYQQPWIAPDDPDTMICASDQGTVITRNATADDPRDVTWSSWLNQPTAQIYHLSVDYRFPYWVTGAQQDSGAVAVRSRGKFANITMRDWEPIGAGGESGMTAGDPLHPGIIFGGAGTRFDLETNLPLPTTAPVSPEPARTDWTQPLVFSKADPHALYYANQFLFKTTDGAQTWTQISPDLTRPDPGDPRQPRRGRRTRHRSQRHARRDLHRRPFAAQRADGLDRHRRRPDPGDDERREDVAERDAGGADVVEPHHDDRGVTHRRERGIRVGRSPSARRLHPAHLSHARPRARRGRRSRTACRPDGYVHVVKEDPARRGLLFAGTERAAFVSFDDGDNWQSLQLNLPTTSVRDFEVYGNDLDRRDARPRLLGDRRHQSAAPDHGHRRARRRVPVQARRCGQRDAGQRQRDTDAEGRAAGGESAERRVHRLLPQDRGDRAGHDRDSGCGRRVPRPVHERSGVGAGMRRGGGWTRRRVRSRRRHRHPEHLGAVASCARAVCAAAPACIGLPGRPAVAAVVADAASVAAPPAGPFTAKLTVNGQTYTQTFDVKPDPRMK